MSRHELFEAIADGLARLVELAPHFDEITIPVDHDAGSDWSTVGDDLRDAMQREAKDHAQELGLEA